jgi:hypothetical protein
LALESHKSEPNSFVAMKKLLLASLASSLLPISASVAAVSFTGSYSQNFDSLANTGTAVAWTQDTTLTGWFLFQYTGGNIADYNAGDGTLNTGHFYSFGTGTATDRALGGTASSGTYFGSPGPASGALAGYIAVSLQNTTGGTLDHFTLSYDGEQWRNGGNATAQTMQLQYGFGSTFAGVTTWNTPGGNFDFTSPVASITAAGVDGNSAGLAANRGGTVSSLTWNDGDTLWVRWIENNDAGNDHGLAIDNFSVSIAPVPEPSSIALGIIGGLAGLVAWKRRR